MSQDCGFPTDRGAGETTDPGKLWFGRTIPGDLKFY
jgi:hypothetical protein